jgi:hypothetical protein
MSANRGRIAFALLLIIVGLWFLAVEMYPGLKALVYGRETWPIQIIGIGALFAIIGILTWLPGFLIPACLVGGIGGLLFWQNATGNWASWSYAWALIPGFVGVGLVLMGVMARKARVMVAGLWNLASSLILFGVFAFAFSGSKIGNMLWPVGIILLGLLIILRPFRRRSE